MIDERKGELAVSTKRRVIAVALAVLFVAFAALSLTFMLVEAGHDCSSEDCPICEQIALLSGTLRTAVILVFVMMITAVALIGSKRLSEILKTGYRADTLVLLKTKLSN